MVPGSRRFSMTISFRPLFLLLLASACVAQQAPASSESKAAESKPASDAKPAQAALRKVDKASAYYHYALAHMYEEQVAMYGRTELANQAMDDHLLLGRLYKVNNDLQKAESEFKTALKLQPDSEEAVTTLALLYTEEGDSTRAAQVLSAVPDASRSAKLYSVLGYTYEQQKEYKKAIDAYRKAIALDRDNLDAIRGLAENLMNDGQSEAALEQYKVIADANPEDAQTYVRIAEIYRRGGKFDLALENLKKAQSMVPDSIDVPYNLARVYQAQGRYDDAAQILQDLL